MSAARMSHGWLSSEARKVRAVPWKLPCTVVGTPISTIVRSMASAASPSDTPSAKLKEIVVATISFNLALGVRSEEHTSELQSRLHLVCRLLLEKKKKHRT